MPVHPSIRRARAVLDSVNEQIAASAAESAARAERLRLERDVVNATAPGTVASEPPPTLVTKSMPDAAGFGGEDYQDISRKRWLKSQGLPQRPAAPSEYVVTNTMVTAAFNRHTARTQQFVCNLVAENNRTLMKVINKLKAEIDQLRKEQPHA
jgi:hypothetical protein